MEWTCQPSGDNLELMLATLQEMRVKRKATISANTEEMKAAIRAGQEMMEAVASAIWSKFEEITISNLVEGVLVSTDLELM
jgi:phage-related protein